MKETFKKIRADLLVSSILCVIFGIVLIVKPIETVSFFCRILALVMIIIGALFLFSYFFSVISSGLSAAMGLIVLLIGMWIMISPEVIQTLIPVVIGVVLLFHGVQGLKLSMDSKGYGDSAWKPGTLLAMISIIFGVLCIVDAFFVVKGAMVLLGIALIYNGVSNLWITTRATKAAKRYASKNEPLDIEFKD